jgi:hypothetical protein
VGFKIRHACLFWSCLLGLFGLLVPVVSVEGGPRAAAVFHSHYLILESLSSAEFGRRPKRSSGFRLAANYFAKDQWAHLRQLGVPAVQEANEAKDDDRRPKWVTAPPSSKKEWKTAISTMKREASALTEPDASAPFRASVFPSCLLQAEADLKPKKDFKEAMLRTNVAGACGMALVR